MGSYILMVIVTADQEAAIEDLFQIKGWTYDKTGVVPLPREQTLLGLNHNKLADCSPGDIQQTFHPSYHQSVSQISNSLLTVDTASAKEIHEKSLTAESQCQSIMVKSTSDSNLENSQVCQNRIQRLPTCNSVNLNYSDISREASKQFEVNRVDPTTQATVKKQDLHQPVNCTSHFTSQTAKSSADLYKDSLTVLADQRNEAIGAAVSGKHNMEIIMCNVNIEDKFQEFNMVKNGAHVETAKESVNDDSKSFLAQKERIDLNNGTNVSKMSNPSLEDRCIVNACFDNKLLNDFDMICKILKNAMQIEFDKKLILPKLEEILTSGRYLWNKSSEMGRVGQGKRELNKDCFLNEKDKSYGVREEKEVINDLDKQKEIEDNDTDLIEDKSPTTPMTFNTQEIEADSDFIGNSGTIVKDARKYKNVKIKSGQSESYSKSTKWIKCEILNCSGDIDKAFEENANDINHLDGVSSLTSKSKESGKWKCNSNKQSIVF
ncbi:uncharacterized protein LOC132729843 [Ruditapes philippinarum]|uniref:uncharacterized protein LOC132729843 n=1 Tax=Ruditapes philippinarum TaxID=129788 RepID=UPI00295AA17A|nr:uncharacterized protein LOC132729843 [Ruditapes philippinarum]